MAVCPADDRHVAVLAFPYGTHAAPLLNLVRRAAAEAPDVTFSFLSTKASNASVFAGLNEEQLHNIRPYDIEDGLPDDFVPSGNPQDPVAYFVKAMPANYRTAMEEAVAKTGRQITCLVSDAFFWFCADMAEEIHAKWVPLWTAGPHPLLAHISSQQIKEKLGPDGVQENKEIDFLTGFNGLKAADLPEGIAELKEDPFSMMLDKMGEALPRATAVAINSFTAVHLPIAHELESKFHMFLNVGPFILTTPQSVTLDDEGCLPWLDVQEEGSVVYISFGSVIMPPPDELAALADALEEGKYPFIWAFRGNPEKSLPDGFMERTRKQGKVVGWAPQMQILKHSAVGVCMTHGGWNSILDCIVGGVPMISRPFFGDQMLNTSTLEHVWEIGVGLENNVFTKEETLRVLEIVMSSEKGKMMREKVFELKDFALEAAGPEGDSTKNFCTFADILSGLPHDRLHHHPHGLRGIRHKIAGAFAAAHHKFSRRHHHAKH
ncbi:hypothetical protein PHAVU_003G148300 [Phaseolus vulgaris]|uniref:Glycosyltransferase n=1 Tax=Phaseolus vulgaris TaxID=3885 RepID=V7CD22_PHAVU|nr:hypothetical protein PHAVU_003G148300g [Phaseolus vulgaris]ESW26786.1 hypothetical protein PHAVU_003G148300g [Phaseolus vulgaris]